MSLNDLSCESLKYLPDALAGKRQFKHLRLKGNFDLGNKGCVIVAKTISMPSFSSLCLEEIDLSECDVHDRGANVLANTIGPHVGEKFKCFKVGFER